MLCFSVDTLELPSKILLSLLLFQVLTAYIKSIEDHGYILHFGLSSFTGFLPKNSQAGKSTCI